MIDFNGTNAFSNPRVLYTPPTGTAVTYSSFFPNAAGIVFEVELSNPVRELGLHLGRQHGRALVARRRQRARPHRLDALNGYGPTGAIYLPSPATADGGAPAHTPAVDVTLNYEPR